MDLQRHRTHRLRRGTIEDDASFAGQAALRLGDATAAYRRMLAVELVCTVRALRMRGVTPAGELGAALGHIAGPRYPHPTDRCT